jgi:transposase
MKVPIMNNSLQLPPIPVSVLGLSNVEVIKVEIDRSNQFIFTVVSTKSDIFCHCCGKLTQPYGKGRTIRLRHLPILGRKTYIDITPPRGRCLHCDGNPTTTQQADWYERKSPQTKAYEQAVLMALINSTLSDVSMKEDLGYQAIQSIIDRRIESEVNWNSINELGLLGIDEISLKKGYKDYVTLITSRIGDKIRIIAVLKGREKGTIKAFLASIPKRLVKTIIAVCTDMYDGYINAVKEALGSNTPVIVDRFHVAKLYRKSLVSLRLKKALSEKEYGALKPAIRILCQNKEYMTPEEKRIMEPLFSYSPLLKVAYEFCCQLTSIFNGSFSIQEAHEKINEWISAVEGSKVACFNKFIQTLRKYKHEIANYFQDRHTSGFVEGFNNKVKVLKRRCYGIFNIKHLFQRIFLDFSGYDFLQNNQKVAMA